MLHDRGEGGLIKRSIETAGIDVRRQFGLVSRRTRRSIYAQNKDWKLEWYTVAQDRKKWREFIEAIKYEP